MKLLVNVHLLADDPRAFRLISVPCSYRKAVGKEHIYWRFCCLSGQDVEDGLDEQVNITILL